MKTSSGSPGTLDEIGISLENRPLSHLKFISLCGAQKGLPDSHKLWKNAATCQKWEEEFLGIMGNFCDCVGRSSEKGKRSMKMPRDGSLPELVSGASPSEKENVLEKACIYFMVPYTASQSQLEYLCCHHRLMRQWDPTQQIHNQTRYPQPARIHSLLRWLAWDWIS